MKSNIVFYIDKTKLKFLQVSGTQKKVVTGVDVVDINDNDDLRLLQALKDLIKKWKLRSAESGVTVVFPRSWTILRLMTFPSHQEEEIRSMIDLQLGSHIPYSKEEVEVDFQILSKTADGYANVAVIIIPQEIAMRYWKIFSSSQISVHRMTVSSIGLWLLYQQPLFDNAGAIWDLDLERSEICLCDKTRWLTSREIAVGFSQIEKMGYEEILNQWELTRNNALSEKSTEMKSIYLVSSTERAGGLGIEMAKVEADLSIKEIVLTKILNLNKGLKWPKSIIEDGVSLAPLAGIAFASQLPPVDLTPRSVKHAQVRSVYQRQLIGLVIWGTLGLLTLGLAAGMGFFKKNIQLSQLEDQLRDTKHEAFQVQSQLQKINNIEGMVRARLIFSNLAHEIDRLLPSQVYLVNIVISDGNVLSVQGVSSSPVDINQFQRDMDSSHSFSNVSLDYVNKRVTQQGELDYFKITCTLNGINSGQ